MLYIAFDTKAGEMEHINKAQSLPLRSLIQRGKKKLFIFIYQFFFPSSFEVVSQRQNNMILQQYNSQPTTDKQSRAAPRCMSAGHDVRYRQKTDGWEKI